MNTSISLTPPKEIGVDVPNPLSIQMDASGVIFDASNLDLLLDMYLADCITTGIVEKTVISYTAQLRPFRAWWASQSHAHKNMLSRETIKKFHAWLHNSYQTKRNSDPSQNTMRSACRRVRQFLHWLYKTGRIGVEISEWMELPAAPLPEGRALDSNEIEALFEACHGMYRLRNAAMLAFLFETGVRCVEASFVTYDATTILPNGTGYTRLDFVKRNKDIDMRRTVAFGPITGQLLRMLAFTTMRTSGKIFDLTDRGIGYVLSALAHHSGIDVTTHDARKTFATNWVRNFKGSNPYLGELLLKKQMGHRPANVLERHYLILDHNDILKDYVSPLDNVKIPGLKMLK